MCAFVIKQPLSKKDLSILAERFTEADPESIDFLVRWLICTAELEHLLENHFSQFSMSQARFSCLMTIFRNPDHRVKPIEIAEKLGVTRGNMTGILDNLEKEELIIREDDPEDRRINYVKLTSKGNKFLKQMLPTHFSRIKEISSALNKSERHTFIQCIEKLSTKLKDMQLSCPKQNRHHEE